MCAVKLSLFIVNVVQHVQPKVDLAGPIEPPEVDETLNDIELFRAYCLPITDMWEEERCVILNSRIYKPCCSGTNINIV